MLSLIAVLIGLALLFVIPAWAAWTTWPHRKYRAALVAIGWTATWIWLILQLAV